MKRISKKPSLKQLLRRVELIVFDFDGVFTDNQVLVLEDGREAVSCNRSDGLGIGEAHRHGLQTLVISKEQNPVVTARCRKLNVDCRQGIDGKLAVLRSEAKRRGVALDAVAYMGNDINDLECMREVGLPVCVQDGFPDVKKAAMYTTRKTGGHGAVREFIDLVLGAKG